MNVASKVVERLTEMVRQRNRELAVDAMLKFLTGVVFCLLTFGMLFWMSWFIGIFLVRQWLAGWQFAAMVTGLFFVVAMWSAWRRVDPTAELQPLTDQQILFTLISQASSHVLYFSPRHATAGAAIVLIGGPANMIEAFGIWAHRLQGDETSIEKAAHILASCEANFPVEQVRHPAAAWLLRRLALIKIVPSGESAALALTEKGESVLAGKAKRTKGTGDSKKVPKSRDDS